jgi:hypothetical protein
MINQELLSVRGPSLPSNIMASDGMSTYERYKLYTGKFLAWLATSSSKQGYKLIPTEQPASTSKKPTNRAKGKVRKDQKARKKTAATNNEPQRYIMTTRQIEEQVCTVAGSKSPPYMPKSIQVAISRAIQLRELYAGLFQAEADADQASNISHQYFIKVLKNAVETLSKAGCMTKQNVPYPRQMPDISSKPSFSSIFDKLELENLDENEDFESDPRKSATKSNKSPNVLYEAEADVETDFFFQIFCFYHELHYYQEFVSATFIRYLLEEIDLLAATIIANQTFECVRQLEENFYNAAPSSKQDIALSHMALMKEFHTVLGCEISNGDESTMSFTTKPVYICPPERSKKEARTSNIDHDLSSKDDSEGFRIKSSTGFEVKASYVPTTAKDAEPLRGLRCSGLLYHNTASVLDGFMKSYQTCRSYPVLMFTASKLMESNPALQTGPDMESFEVEYTFLCQYMNEMVLDMVQLDTRKKRRSMLTIVKEVPRSCGCGPN